MKLLPASDFTRWLISRAVCCMLRPVVGSPDRWFFALGVSERPRGEKPVAAVFVAGDDGYWRFRKDRPEQVALAATL
jgi:hypothetical protein